jgi:hypothetical protein
MNLIIESIGRPIERDFSKTSVVHARNSVIIADAIGADIITGEKDVHLARGKKYKNIICCYASPYMKWRKVIHILHENPDATLWFLVNDYTVEDNIMLREILKLSKGERKYNMICNTARKDYRQWILNKKVRDADRNILGVLNDFIDEWHTLNLNALIYNYTLPYDPAKKTKSAIYYGTMRKWRLGDFLEYQNADITLSTSKRTQSKFIDRGITKFDMIDKLSWQKGNENLAAYKFSLYIEDEHTHSHTSGLANRWYESLMCNVVNLVDVKCVDNLKKSGFNVPEKYIVDGAQSFDSKVIELSEPKAFAECLLDNERFKAIAKAEHIEVMGNLVDLLSKSDNIEPEYNILELLFSDK